MNRTKIEWREIPGFPDYMVSSTGLIGSRKRERFLILRPIQSKDGYLYVFLYGNCGRTKMRVHRAVLLAFVGNPGTTEECRHLDGNPANNDLSNLCWGTRLENTEDKRRHGRLPCGERSGTHKLTRRDVQEIRRLHGTMSLRTLGERFGVSHTCIRRAALGIKWSHLE